MGKTHALILAVGTLLGGLAVGENEINTLDAESIYLELPEIDSSLHPQGVLQVPSPQAIRTAVFHIPASRVHQVFSKVNTIGTGTIQTLRVRKDEVLCELELDRYAKRYAFEQGENILEIKIIPRPGDEATYASWIITPPGDPNNWRKSSVAAGRPETFEGGKWAVVIGISKYEYHEEGGADLRFAHRDAAAIRDFLVSPEGGEFAPEKTLLITDDEATYLKIRTALFNFLASTQPEDLVFIFFAGHGVPDPKNPENYFFMAYDSEYSNLGGTALPMWDIKNVLDFTVRSRRVVVLADTCHSGAVAQSSGSRSFRRFNFFNRYLERLSSEEGRLVLTASQAREESWEFSHLDGGHGAFTYSVLKGLKGAADENYDGIVTAGELLNYVEYVVPRETRNMQHPSYREEGFNMSFPLALVSDSTGAEP